MFPIGTISHGSSDGLFGSFFEPNGGCFRIPITTSLVSQAESNYLVTRKKAEVYHVFTYKFENIWNREYRLIEKYFKWKNGRTTMVHFPDLSTAQPCTLSGATGATATVQKGGSITTFDTSYYSTTLNEGGDWVFVWHPETNKFRIGQISTITTNTSLAFPTATDYGNLGNGSTNYIACPFYRGYFTEDKLNAEVTGFNPEKGDDGGPMWTVTVSFIQYGVK